MVDDRTSAARFIAMRAMSELGFDPNDFRVRDRVINAIAPHLEAMLDYAAKQGNT
jgi:hypothetical protein